MGVTKHRLTVSRCESKEYWTLNLYLQILEYVNNEYHSNYEPLDMLDDIFENFGDVDEMAYIKLGSINTSDWDTFFSDLIGLVRDINYSKIIFNLDTVMHNCIDLEERTLSFNTKITEALELKEKVDKDRFLFKNKRKKNKYG